MKNELKGILLLAGFIIWTIMIQSVDVQPVGVNGTDIGFAAFNSWFHNLTGVHIRIYTITELSMILNILLVLFLAMTREVYAVIMAFLLLVVKGLLFFKYIKTGA